VDPKLLEARKLLRERFDIYAPRALKIKTKTQEIVPLKFNAAQEILHKAVEEEMASRGRVRIVILKGRQQGLSTYVGGRLYSNVSQNTARKAMVITHAADSTRALFDMTKRYHDNAPPVVKPSTRYASRRELYFNALDSGYIVGTAGADKVGRGDMFSDLHVSELAFWAPNTAKDTLNGLLQCVPDSDGTFVFIESTANGYNLFQEYWAGAVAGTNGFRAVFIPWYLQPEYTTDVAEDFEPTPDEKRIIALYGLTYGQLQWRRYKVAQNGLDLFRQEYPFSPEEAFLASGRPVFHPEVVAARLKEVKAPIQRLALHQTGGDEKEMYQFEWDHHPAGELLVYRKFDPKETYYIGADVSEGIKGLAWSVAQVLDGKRRQVAIWRGYADPDLYTRVLYHLAKHFNDAQMIVELNNHGILPNSRLSKDYNYPNLYYTTEVDKITERESTTFGFKTSVKTKPLIIDQLRAHVRDSTIEINDRQTLEEMRTFVVTETGSMEAEKGCFDDTVMALALANHINEGSFKPVESTDDFYVQSI
jgi:hypothetical protein